MWLGWTLLALFVVGYAAIKLNDALGRRRNGLSRAPFTVIAAKVVVLAALGAAFTYEMGVNRNLSTNAFFSNKAQGMPALATRCCWLSAQLSSAAPRCSAGAVALSTPFSAAWSSRSSPTA